MRRSDLVRCRAEVDVSKHGDLANRIFRTVVLSGAMLGTPLMATAEEKAPPAQTKPAPPAKADTWDGVNKELEANHTKLDAAVGTYIASLKSKKNQDTSLAKVTELRTTRTGLDERLAKTERPAFKNEKAAPAVEAAELKWAEADKNLMSSIDAASAAKEDADVKTAITNLEKAKKDRTAAWTKVKAERTKANKRPRPPQEERPVGRGFILS
jgi:hypothetical protein